MRVVIGEDEALLRESLVHVLEEAVMLARARRERDAIDRLTPRQTEVLALIAEGRSDAAIARRLAITEKALAR